MSFSGRLSIVDSDPHESVTSTSNSIIPLSIAQRTNMESPSPPSMGIGNLKRLNSRSHQKQNRFKIKPLVKIHVGKLISLSTLAE